MISLMLCHLALFTFYVSLYYEQQQNQIFSGFVFWPLQFKLIHSADLQTRTVVIIIFGQISVRPSVPSFQISKNKSCVKIMITTGGIVGLAEGIIDDTCFVESLLLGIFSEPSSLLKMLLSEWIRISFKRTLCLTKTFILSTLP